MKMYNQTNKLPSTNDQLRFKKQNVPTHKGAYPIGSQVEGALLRDAMLRDREYYSNLSRQAGVAYPPSDTVCEPAGPVYGHTTLSTPIARQRSRLMAALARMFLPDIPPAVVRSMETVSLSKTEDEWELLNWDENIVSDVENQTAYVFTSEERYTLISLLGLVRITAPPAISEAPASIYSLAYEAVEKPNLILSPLPDLHLTPSTPRFPTNRDWSYMTWSPHIVDTIKYDPRSKKWNKSITLVPSVYDIAFTIQTDGQSPVMIDVTKLDGSTTGLYSMEFIGAVPLYELRLEATENVVIVTKVSSYQATPVNVICRMRCGLAGSRLGLSEPVWVTDHTPRPTVSSAQAKLEQGRQHDLLAEGIEANPGPVSNYLIDHWESLAGSVVFDKSIIAAVDLVTSNKYALLAAFIPSDTDSVILLEEPDQMEIDYRVKKKRTMQAKANSKRGDTSSEQDEPKPHPPQQRAFRQHNTDPEAAAASRKAAITRISNTLKRNPIMTAVFISKLSSYSAGFLRELAAAAWGLGWEQMVDMSMVQFCVFAILNRVSPSDLMSVIIDADPILAKRMATNPDVTIPLIQESLLEIGNLAYIEAKARMNNKTVHATNGNIFTDSMSDVDAAAALTTFFSPNPQAEVVRPKLRNNIILGNVVSNNRMQRVPTDHSGLLGDGIDATGAIVHDLATPYPCSALQLVRSPYYYCERTETSTHHDISIRQRETGLGYINVQFADYTANLIEASVLSNTINAQIQNSGMYKTRETDVTQAGFGLSDLEDLNSFITMVGVSMERPVTILLMLHSLLQHSRLENIPPTNFLIQSDTVRYGDASAIAFNWNDISDYSISNEINDSVTVWPFDGTAGRLRFHVTLQTVPSERRASAFFVPSGVLGHCDAPQRALALLIMSLSNWPFCCSKYVVTETEQLNSGWGLPINPASGWHDPAQTRLVGKHTHVWALNHTLVNMPGPRDIDIVLPRKASSRLPRSGAEAMVISTVVPTTGPTALQRNEIHYAANSQIPINWMGGADASTSLTDYLNSWLPSMSPVNVVSMLSAFTQLWGVDHHILASWYNVIGLIYRFPPLLNGQKPPLKEISGRLPPRGDSPDDDPDDEDYAACSDADTQDEPPGEEDDLYSLAQNNADAVTGAQDVNRGLTPSDVDLVGKLAEALKSKLQRPASCHEEEGDSEFAEADSAACFCDIIHTKGSEQYTIMLTTPSIYNFDLTRDLPLPIEDYNTEVLFRMYALDNHAWNKVVTNLAVSPELRGGSSLSIQPQLVDRMYIHTETIEAITLAFPVSAACSQFAVSNDPYRNMFNYTEFPRIRQLALSMFASTAAPLSFMPGAFTPVLNNIFAGYFGCNLPRLPSPTLSNTGEVTVLGRWHYSPMAAVFADERVQAAEIHAGIPGNGMSRMRLYAPVVLPEVWVHILSTNTPKSQSSFPPPYGLNGPCGYSSDLRPVQIGLSQVTPYMDKDTSIPFCPTNKLLNQTDPAYWNVRLFARCLPNELVWRFMSGPLPPDAYLIGALPAQVRVNNPVWSPRGQLSVYTSSTLAFPMMWGDGRRVYPVAAIARANQISRIQLRLSRAAMSVWLIGAMTVNNNKVFTDVKEDDIYGSFLSHGAVAVEPVPPPAQVVSQLSIQDGGNIVQADPPRVEPAANIPLDS